MRIFFLQQLCCFAVITHKTFVKRCLAIVVDKDVLLRAT
jgi:hypothetical protein